MKKPLFVIIPILLLVFASGCVEEIEDYDTSDVTMEFSSGTCDESVSPYDNSQLGIRETNWIGQNTLEIRAYVSINCAVKIEGSDFAIERDKITLEYLVGTCNPCTLCNCAHEVKYTFQNIPRRHYTYELKRVI